MSTDKYAAEIGKMKRQAGKLADEACAKGDRANSKVYRQMEVKFAEILCLGQDLTGDVSTKSGGK